MSQKPVTQRAAAEKVVKDIHRATRKQHSAEEKIRIVLAGSPAERQTDGMQKSIAARDPPTVTPPEAWRQGLAERLAPAGALPASEPADAQAQLHH